MSYEVKVRELPEGCKAKEKADYSYMITVSFANCHHGWNGFADSVREAVNDIRQDLEDCSSKDYRYDLPEPSRDNIELKSGCIDQVSKTEILGTQKLTRFTGEAV